MRKPLRLLILVIVLLSLALALSACEKERVPPAASTPAAGASGGAATTGQTPQPAVTRVVLPNANGQGAASTPSSQAPAAATVQPAESAPASATGERIHTVAAGETLARIAARYGVTAESIMQANDITNPDIISVGQKLTIPGAGGTAETGGATGGATGGSTGGATGSTTTYTVKAGETLYSIADRYGVSMADLQKANNITNPNTLYAGQVLVIPVGGSAEATPASADDAKSYTVQRGDTLAAIARKYGVSVAALQQANNIANPNTIRPGQVLTLP